MGRYRNEPNIIFKADFLEQSFIKEKVCAKNKTPHIVAITPELIPVRPKYVGNKPNGIKNKV